MCFCDQGCDQVAFVEFDCMTFGDLREFDTFFAGVLPVILDVFEGQKLKIQL